MPQLADPEVPMRWSEIEERDPRVLLHSIVSGPDEPEAEFKVRGTARIEHDPTVQRRYAAAVAANLGWNPTPGRFHLFRIDIDSVAFVRYDPTGDQHVAVWPPGKEFVRRATSVTSVGDPEDEVALLVA